MADAPLWLPPLNRHTDYTIRFIAVQNDLPFEDSSPSTSTSTSPLPTSSPSPRAQKTNPSPRFRFCIHAFVDFYSELDSRSASSFRGLNYLTGETFISCRGLMNCSTKKAKKILKNMLSNFGISFPLYHVLFVQKPYKRRCSYSTEKIWVRGFQNFLRSLSKKHMGKDVIIPLLLRIEKSITIPDSVYKRWFRWYNYSKQLDPDFGNKYKKAISRPRCYAWELFCEEDMNFDQISTAIFREVKSNTSSNGETGVCSICLEDLSGEEKGFIKSLPCAHLFHLHCIRNWLYVSQVCPLCRATLPLICRNGKELTLI